MVKWSIGTYARLRPPRRGHDCAKFLLEKLAGQQGAAIVFPPPDEDDDRRQLKQRDELEFRYSDIFDNAVSQEQIFNDVCLDIVHSALDGYNGTILAYGQTGSGKTYTITGGEHYADRGIIPRVLSTIFEEFERRASMRYSCYISFLEIYNESVYDLLDRSHTDRPIEEWTKVLLMDDEDGDMHFRNLGVYEAVSEEEALNLLFLGNMNRVTSDTPMNQASSRSHSIFSVMIEARPTESDLIVTSKLHLVDLAGSERVYKREGTQRMRTEGKHINLSLHHLEQVILSLRAKRNNVAKGHHVPYRNSMLTSVLRGSLGGNCKSVFIATLNPESEFLDESISTCRFMQRCAEVTVDVAANTEVDAEKRLEVLEKANAALQAANGELHTRITQLELEVHAQDEQLTGQEKVWEQRIQQMQAEAAAAIEAATTNAQAEQPVDWMQCEVLVEKLLRAGELPRRRLPLVCQADDDNASGEDEDSEEVAQGLEIFGQVAEELRSLGVEAALASLAVLKESAEFATNAAAELQERLRKQQSVVDHLEERLQEQRGETDQLRLQLQRRQEESEVTDIPRSMSHPGPRQHSSSSRVSSAVNDDRQRQRLQTESDSEFDDDSDSRSDSVASRTNSRRSCRSHSTAIKQVPSESESSLRGRKLTFSRAAIPTQTPSMVTLLLADGGHSADRRLELLRGGSLFVKYGRFGKPHVRFVWCSSDLEYLHYRTVRSAEPKASIATRALARVLVGQATRVFERARQPGRTPFCFSVEYDDGRTLDLEVADGGEQNELKMAKRAEWVDALQHLVRLKAAALQPSVPTDEAAR